MNSKPRDPRKKQNFRSQKLLPPFKTQETQTNKHQKTTNHELFHIRIIIAKAKAANTTRTMNPFQKLKMLTTEDAARTKKVIPIPPVTATNLPTLLEASLSLEPVRTKPKPAKTESTLDKDNHKVRPSKYPYCR